jgi:hypothetical protein
MFGVNNFNGPQGGNQFTGGSVGSTVGKFGLGLLGTAFGGPIGGLIGSRVGGPIGSLVGSGLSSLFGPKGLGLLFHGGPAASGPAAMPSAPSGGGVTASAGGWKIDASGNLVSSPTYQGAGPSLGHYITQMGQGVTGYGAQAMSEARKRNII